MPSLPDALGRLQDAIVDCRRCPRLIEHCRQVAEVKRRAYRDREYWGRPSRRSEIRRRGC
jgi:hypothetical protein